MNRLRLLARLARQDLRRRAVETLLLLAALAVAATTMTIGLLLHGQTAAPYAETRALTAGPDVVATQFPSGRNLDAVDRARLAAVARNPEVLTSSPVLPTTWTSIRIHGTTGVAQVQGRPAGESVVDQPRVVSGRWVSARGVVVERAFATALGVHVGDTIRLDGDPTPVVGIGVSAALPPYPQLCTVGCILDRPGWEPAQLGLVWASASHAMALATPREPIVDFQFLRLRDPASAQAFATRYSDHVPRRGPILVSWQEVASRQAEQLTNERAVVVFGSTLLVLLALATLVVLVAGRMADEVRRIGTLKAAGATPGFVARLLLVSYLAVGLVGALLGVVAGRMLAPRLVSESAGLLGRLGPTSLSLREAAAVVAANLTIVLVASALPAWRAARTSTVHALADSGRTPRRGRLLVVLSAQLPTPALLGVRLASRRPRRALLTMLSISVAVCGSVAALYSQVQLDADHTAAGAPVDPHATQLHLVITAVVALLAIMSAVNLIFVTRANAVDARHMLAVARTLGATPGQTAAGLGIAQLIPAVVGLVLGSIAGVGIIRVLSDGPLPQPPLLQWSGLVVLTILAVVVLTALPARLEARRPIAVTLAQR